MHDSLAQEIDILETGARVRLKLPFARKSEISLKKVGLELIVGVDGQRRTIALPPALAALRPSGATFEDGALEVSFDGDERPDQSDNRSR
jgi:arsenite-transporting ATPase